MAYAFSAGFRHDVAAVPCKRWHEMTTLLDPHQSLTSTPQPRKLHGVNPLPDALCATKEHYACAQATTTPR